MPTRELETPYGPARLITAGKATRGTVLLMHGAGSSTDVPVLAGAAAALARDGWRSVRLDMPYIVAGRRTPPPTRALDVVVDLVVALVRPSVLVGRSSGARSACRAAVRHPGVELVITVGFPYSPPGKPEVTRADELTACPAPILAIQGDRDAFGGPELLEALHLPQLTVHPVTGGDHELKALAQGGRSSDELAREAVEIIVGAAAEVARG